MDVFALIFVILLLAAGVFALTLGAPGLFVSIAAGDHDRWRRAQEMHAIANSVGVALLVQAAATALVFAGYPDLAAFSGIAGLQNIYALAHVFIFPALVCALAAVSQHHVSVAMPYVLLGAMQGLVLFALTAVGSNATAYALLIVFYAILTVIVPFKALLTGHLTSGAHTVQLAARATVAGAVVLYAGFAILFPFLAYNVGAASVDVYLFAQPPIALGMFLLVAAAGAVASCTTFELPGIQLKTRTKQV
jgi:hypothetical protein